MKHNGVIGGNIVAFSFEVIESNKGSSEGPSKDSIGFFCRYIRVKGCWQCNCNLLQCKHRNR